MAPDTPVDIPEWRVGLAAVMRQADAEPLAYREDLTQCLVHTAMLAAGLGRRNPECPIADVVLPGMTVLLKPNWVLHYNQSGGTMDCMVTHPVFLEAVLREILAAGPGRVIVGDAPIQLCQFDVLVPHDWRDRLCRTAGIPLDFVDFRRQRVTGTDLNDGVVADARSADHYVLFDLGGSSLLEPICDTRGRFRVTNYDPDALRQTHCCGRHQYLLCKEAFEADVIINLPKLKTHRKAGITGAVKNLVGLNGNKDYLPHHRVGGTTLGGDCYPGVAPLKRLAEFCLDQANRRINTPAYRKWHGRACRILRWHQCIGDREIEGGWYGNDTTWRMVLDLNRLLLYGRPDGTLADTIQRRIYTLTDAIIAGQGEGPLAPEPLELGVVTFAASSAFADMVHAGLLGMDYRQLPAVREAFEHFRYPLANGRPEKCVIRADGSDMSWREIVRRYGQPARPPRGWVGRVELEAGHLHGGNCHR